MNKPNRYSLAFHHLGLAVTQELKAFHFLQGLGYTIGDTVFDPEQNVNLAMGRSPGMPEVEVVFKAKGPSPLDNILEKNKDLVYHIAYTSPELKDSLARMEQDGIQLICVSPPKPAILFGGKRVSFYVVRGFGVIEIIETDS